MNATTDRWRLELLTRQNPPFAVATRRRELTLLKR